MIKLILFLILLIPANSHASLWRRCIDALVTDDPYGFKQTSTEDLQRLVSAIDIKLKWGKRLSSDTLEMYQFAKDELERRIDVEEE